MSNTKPDLTYIFINPNTPKQIEQLLKQILIEKLMSLSAEIPTAVD